MNSVYIGEPPLDPPDEVEPDYLVKVDFYVCASSENEAYRIVYDKINSGKTNMSIQQWDIIEANIADI